MTLSITTIWDESIAFIQRELHLLLPLSLATLALGSAGVDIANGLVKQTDSSGIKLVADLVVLASLTLSLIGQLAITALTLSSGMSVGEALRRGAARFPKLLAIGALVGVAIIAVALPLVMGLSKQGYDLTAEIPQLPAWANIYLLGIVALLMWLSARLLPLIGSLVDKNPPVFAAIAGSFALTKGNFAKLLAVFLLYLVVALVTTSAATSVVGIIFGFLGKALGVELLGKVMAALAGGMVSAALGLVSTVFATKVYQKLAAPV
jgi:hypothetical protein